MDLTNLKMSGIDSLNVSDSLNAPLLEIEIGCNENTIIPESNELIIYVDKSEEVTEERKQYVFSLSDALNYSNSVSDKFILKPIFENNKVFLSCYVERNGEEAAIEYLDYQLVTLFEGTNYITTNYNNCSISIVYPKKCDLVKYFLNNTVFSEFITNSEEKILEDLVDLDMFTKTENGVNITANNITANCISSSNNKFSLDSDGNLIVETITARSSSSQSINFNNIYPVGSIYMNVTNVNPTTLFGGTWQQIQDSFLLACGSTYENGATGGEASHILTTSEMPSHTHTQASCTNSGNHKHGTRGQWMTSGNNNRCVAYQDISSDPTQTNSAIRPAGDHTHTITLENTGGGEAHNNMPPYLAVYVWKRIS